MIINAEPAALAFKGFKSVFTDAYLETPANSDKIVMTVPLESRDETYSWLGQFTEIKAELRANFLPDRQASKSAPLRWRHREGQHLAAQPQDSELMLANSGYLG